ncbi:MAG: spore cortex-lytic protein [Ruminococcaceae bacterium]|nr:spore cortex-lytic protein [Oscillospiraceae bacterium]
MAELPYVPDFLTVHLGSPGSNAENVTVSFPDYLKNVASSELYPTWPENALRANIYAQASYALNRIYTEYYRERGYNYDITNDTNFDQAFIKGRDIFENVSNIVDDIFNSYIRRSDTIVPLFAQYCNGTTSVCSGLSQWGTVDLANQGYLPFDILKYYYGDDIVLVENVPVQGITSSVPDGNLSIGTVSNDVRTLQIRLNRISTNYPAIPKIYSIDGIFGLDTRDAVREFQRIFDLPIDGIVGVNTWYRIQSIYNGIKKLNSLVSESITYDEVSKQLPEELKAGDEGPYVSSLQYFLEFISEYDSAVPFVPITGVYDQATIDAVTAFQKEYGLPVTGIVDRDDGRLLYDSYIGILNSLPDSQFVTFARPYPGYRLYRGIEDEYVKYLQQYLNRISEVYTDIPKLSEDGIFGQQTQDAVSIFQSIFNQYVNGIVGTVTWNAIADTYDDLVSGSQVNEGQYPGYVLSEKGGT